MNGFTESEIETKRRLLSPYHEATQYYLDQQWDQAALLFTQCLSIVPQDTVSKIYLNRCQKYKLRPPGANWNGVSQMA